MDSKVLWKMLPKNVRMMVSILLDFYSIYSIIKIGFIIKKEEKEKKTILNCKFLIGIITI